MVTRRIIIMRMARMVRLMIQKYYADGDDHGNGDDDDAEAHSS